MTGAQLAGQAKRIRPETVRILLTGQRTLDTAIDGINQGEIFRFLNKPFEDEQLRAAVAEAVQRHQELLALSGDRAAPRASRSSCARRSKPSTRASPRSSATDGHYVVTADPWSDALDARPRRARPQAGALMAVSETTRTPTSRGSRARATRRSRRAALYALATLGSRMPAFHHDAASKLQSLMMALDEISELTSADAVDLRSADRHGARGAARAQPAPRGEPRAREGAAAHAHRAPASWSRARPAAAGVRAARRCFREVDVRVAAPAIRHALAVLLDLAAARSPRPRRRRRRVALDGSASCCAERADRTPAKRPRMPASARDRGVRHRARAGRCAVRRTASSSRADCAAER